jgi:hypothetical protein
MTPPSVVDDGEHRLTVLAESTKQPSARSLVLADVKTWPAALAVAVAAVAAPHAAAARSCAAPVGAQILARHGATLVWTLRRSRGEERAVACVSGRTIALATGDSINMDYTLSRFRFAGRWLAYVDDAVVSHYGDSQMYVTVVDLRGGQGRRSMFLGNFGGFDVRSQIIVTGLAVDRSGAMAWREAANVEPWDDGDAAPYDAVAVFDRGGARFVARTAPGTITGFRLKGSRVSWTADGASASASMHGHASCPHALANCWTSS